MHERPSRSRVMLPVFVAILTILTTPSSSGAQSAPGGSAALARTHYQLGIQYERNGQAGKAIDEYRSAFEADPSFLDAYIQCGNLLVRSQRFAEAAEIYRKATLIDRRRADLHLVIGDLSRQVGDTRAAREAYSSVLTIEPMHQKATIELARIHMRSGSWAESIRVLDGNRSIAGDPAALAIRAYCEHRMGRLEVAAQLYARSLEANPDNGEARLNLGIVEAARGRASEAISHFQHAVLLVPDKAQAYRYLGLAQIDAGRDAEALESLRRAVAENPRDVAARYRMAQVLLKLGRASEAVSQLEALRSTSGNFPELSALLGRSLLAAGQVQRARAELERAAADTPGDTVILFALAETYQKAGDTRRALETFEAALAGRGAPASAYRSLADLHAVQGNGMRALEYERIYQEQRERSDIAGAVASERRAWQLRLDEVRSGLERQLAEARRSADDRVRAAEAARAQVRVDTYAEWARIQREADERVAAVRRELEAMYAARAAGSGPAATAPAPGPSTIPQSLAEARQALAYSEQRAAAAENQLRLLREGRLDTTAQAEIWAARAAMEQARQKVMELTAALERERATREEAQAGAERVRAEATREVLTMRALVEGLDVEIWRGLGEIRADTSSLQAEDPLARLKFYVQNVRLAADARVARAQLAAEQRLNEARMRAESQVERILRDAQGQVDRARAQAAEEVRRSQTAADSRIAQQVAQERERLAAEALARRMAQAEQLRASIEADAQVRFLEEKAKIEATYEADRIRMQREYDQQLDRFQAEYQRRLEAAQAEARRASEQVEALTRNDTGLLMRSEVYQKLVRENALLREDLASARRRMEELGRDKEDLVREADGLRREFANVQARLAALEQESRRFAGIEVLAEPLRAGVNLNAASLAELQALPGVGIQEARNIVWYRENVGPFRTTDELTKVPGFEAAKAQAIRALVRVR